MAEKQQKPAPRLGWTKQYKLTVNGQRVGALVWYDGFVAITVGQEKYFIDTPVFERFISEHWDPNKTWYYV